MIQIHYITSTTTAEMIIEFSEINKIYCGDKCKSYYNNDGGYRYDLHDKYKKIPNDEIDQMNSFGLKTGSEVLSKEIVKKIMMTQYNKETMTKEDIDRELKKLQEDLEDNKYMMEEDRKKTEHKKTLIEDKICFHVYHEVSDYHIYHRDTIYAYENITTKVLKIFEEMKKSVSVACSCDNSALDFVLALKIITEKHYDYLYRLRYTIDTTNNCIDIYADNDSERYSENDSNYMGKSEKHTHLCKIRNLE